MLLQLSRFPPLFPCALHTHLPPAFPHLSSLTSMGCTCKSFGFSISYTILNLPLSIFYLPFYAFSSLCPFPILPLPADNLPCDLHFCDSVLVLVVCLVFFFLFLFSLRSVVASCEFVVILLFVFLIFFFFFDKSL